MQKAGLKQLLQQKLSPQQIQFIKLLQVSSAELESRIKEELESNPVLEEKDGQYESNEDHQKEELTTDKDQAEEETQTSEEDFDLNEYLQDEGYASEYKIKKNTTHEAKKESILVTSVSLHDTLITQLGFLDLNPQQYDIGMQLIGSIEEDGYIQRSLEAIVNDLAFSGDIITTPKEVEEILKKIQNFDPPGIAARNLKECLLIQLNRLQHADKEKVAIARQILEKYHKEFFKKHYAKIAKKIEPVNEEGLKEAIELITKLNPKPGGGPGSGMIKNQYLIPDFILSHRDGKFNVTLNTRNAPELRISRSYSNMLENYKQKNKKDKQTKNTISFVKQKVNAAKWFIEAIQQRQHTLLKTMRAILDFQFEYFLKGDETKLKPMILKDIAQIINMDISTVSRVVNNKTIQTHFGIFSLKHFFSEGIYSDTGKEVSNREVKKYIVELIDKEDKSNPLSDEKLENLLNKKGYHIARRTVAKYREQLRIPVARLRKKML